MGEVHIQMLAPGVVSEGVVPEANPGQAWDLKTGIFWPGVLVEVGWQGTEGHQARAERSRCRGKHQAASKTQGPGGEKRRRWAWRGGRGAGGEALRADPLPG